MRTRLLLSRRKSLGQAPCVLLVLCAFGCAPELEPISEITGLRLLGVRKSAPYAHPGEEVTLQMRWEDGREELPDTVQTFFGFWCLNPPGNSYAGCLTPDQPSTPPQVFLNEETVTIEIPENSLFANQRDPSFPDSGSAFVFHAVCAGELLLGALESADDFESSEPSDLLPRCLGENGEDLGPEDFIVGYSQIFLFDELRNENPVITGFRVDGAEVEIDCIDEQCQEPLELSDAEQCSLDSPCIAPCDDDGDLTCPETRIAVVIDEDSAERDELARIAFGRDLQESMWVSYFVDRGGISSPLKLVNDAELGWQDDYSTGFFSPKEPGPFRIWAVVRDNRGGASWTRLSGFIEEE